MDFKAHMLRWDVMTCLSLELSSAQRKLHLKSHTAEIYSEISLCHLGGHVNPAITVASFLSKKISLVTGLLYIVSQLLGGTFGCWIVAIVSTYSQILSQWNSFASDAIIILAGMTILLIKESLP